MIKSLFRLSLRMVTGFVQSLIKLCGLNWTAPDYTTLCRRQKHIDIAILENILQSLIIMVFIFYLLQVSMKLEYYNLDHRQEKIKNLNTGWVLTLNKDLLDSFKLLYKGSKTIAS